MSSNKAGPVLRILIGVFITAGSGVSTGDGVGVGSSMGNGVGLDFCARAGSMVGLGVTNGTPGKAGVVGDIVGGIRDEIFLEVGAIEACGVGFDVMQPFEIIKRKSRAGIIPPVIPLFLITNPPY